MHKCMTAGCLIQFPVYQQELCQCFNGNGAVHTVPLQNLATIRRCNVSRGTWGTDAIGTPPTDWRKIVLKQPGPAPLVAKDCKQRVPVRRLARGKNDRTKTDKPSREQLPRKRRFCAIAPSNARRLKYARWMPPVVTSGVWRIGKVVVRDRARRVKRRISKGARIVIINLR